MYRSKPPKAPLSLGRGGDSAAPAPESEVGLTPPAADHTATIMVVMRERVAGISSALSPASALLLALLAFAFALAGCGGGEDATGGEETNAGEPVETAVAGDPREKLKSHEDSGGGAAQYENARSAGTVVEWGEEAGPEDFEAVAAALHGYLDAKAVRDWALACEYMSQEAIESIAQFDPAGEEAECSQLLENFSSGTAPEILRRLAIADVGSVRIAGDEAHALYTGAKGFGFFMPMVREDGLWKVRALAPSILP